jgi:hypothetical protein
MDNFYNNFRPIQSYDAEIKKYEAKNIAREVADAVNSRNETLYQNQASSLFRRMRSYIESIENNLKEDEILTIICPLDGITIEVDNFGYNAPDLIIIDGKGNNNSYYKAFTHVNTFKLVTQITKILPEEEPKPKKKIGFQLN